MENLSAVQTEAILQVPILFSLIKDGNISEVRQMASDLYLKPDVRTANDETPLYWAVRYRQEDILEFLLMSGADPNCITSQGRTPLTLASHGGSLRAVRVLLASDADITIRDSHQCDALIYAAAKGHDAIVQCLLGAGASCACVDKDGRSALRHAIQNKHPKTAKILVTAAKKDTAKKAAKDKNDAQRKEESGTIHLAVQNTLVDLLEELLQSGIDVDAVDHQNRTPLMAAVAAKSKPVVDLLLASGANTTIRDKNGNTALMLATVVGHTSILESLTKVKASLDIKNNRGHTALMLASAGPELDEELQTIQQTLADLVDQTATEVQGTDSLFDSTEILIAGGETSTDGNEAATLRGQREDLLDTTKTVVHGKKNRHEVVRTLITAGASLEGTDAKTVLSLATDRGDMETTAHGPDTGDIPGQLPTQLKGLPQAPPEIEATKKTNSMSRNANGQTLLILASGRNDLEQVKALILDGSEVNAKDFKGLTSLMYAAHAGHLEVVDYLLKNKADHAIKNVQGWTSLALAATTGKLEVVNKLVEHGASTDFKFKGVTLLMMVANHGHAEVIKLLLRHGADATMKDYGGSTAFDYATKAGHKESASILAAAKTGTVDSSPLKPVKKPTTRRTSW